MNSEISRREFLKLLSLLPLTATELPSFLTEKNISPESLGLPNILILVFDAFSATNSSLYGYRRETTPNLTRFAERALVYHNHYAGGNFTSPGTASLLTGTYPWTHRAIHLHGTVDGNLVNRNIFNLFGRKGYSRVAYSHNLLVSSLLHQFREDLETFKQTRDLCLIDDQFADRLFSKDFNVAFFSEWMTMRGEGTAPGSLFFSLIYRFFRAANKQNLTKEYGDLFPRGIPSLHSLYFILEDAIDWLSDQLMTLARPYLLYHHVLPPHEPYWTRRDFVDKFKDGWRPDEKPARFFSEGYSFEYLNKNRREYDEYLAYADAEFGRLFDFMLQNKVLDNTIVVVTSDHGEMFERGIRGHVTRALYDPVIRVPLLISYPGLSQRGDIFSSTSCVDVLPTLLHLTSQDIPEWCEGSVLPPFLDQTDDKRQIFSVEAKSNPKHAPLKKATISLMKGDHKLIHYFGYDEDVPSYELFDIANDPAEQFDLYLSRKPVASELAELLTEKLNEVNRRTYG